MAAKHHDRVDPPRAVRFDQLLAAERIAPLHREEQPGAGELAARHRDRALAEIHAHDGLDRVRQIAEGVHEMREAAVARAGFGFGKGDVEGAWKGDVEGKRVYVRVDAGG